MVGDSGVGKSCILEKLLDSASTNTFISTIGVDVKNHTLKDNGRSVKLQASCFEDLQKYIFTRGPWTATPALIKVIETGRINKYFCMQKILKIGVILWENAVCVQSLTFLAQKALFSAQFFGVKMLDYKGVSSVILPTDKCTYMCKRFHQI